MGRWPDGKNPWSSLDLDFVSQPCNLKQRLGETDPSRIDYFDQLRSNHGHTPQTCSRCNHAFDFGASSLHWLTLAITWQQGFNATKGSHLKAAQVYGSVRQPSAP
jgi:hypothetical protein